MFDSVPRSAPERTASDLHRPIDCGVAMFFGEAASQERMEAVVRNSALDVARANTLAHARTILDQNNVEVIVMGSLASGQIDFSACHELSRLRSAPIMVLADRDDATDRILALELGADDWASTSCCDRELAARLKALTRRTRPRDHDGVTVDEIGFAGWRLNCETGALRHQNGGKSSLSKAELIILKFFVRNMGRVLTRADLHGALGGDPSEDSRNVTVSIFRLRRKLIADDVEVIRTVRSVGYVMDGPVRGRWQ